MTIQAINITSGYRWGQNTKNITIYLRIDGANEINENEYTLNVQSRSISVRINNHRGVNYNFKIGKLCGQLEPQGTKIAFQEKQIVITLQKKEYGKQWNDIKERSIHEVYNQMERKIRDGDGQDGPLPNVSDEQQNLQELIGNSDPSTGQTAADLLSNQPCQPPDLGFSLDPFHISDIIPTTSKYPYPNSHSNEKK